MGMSGQQIPPELLARLPQAGQPSAGAIPQQGQTNTAQMGDYNKLMQMRPDLQGQIDPRAAAANPAAVQQQMQATQSYNNMMATPEGKAMLSNLPAGVDKYAVAANPAAYQQQQAAMKAQQGQPQAAAGRMGGKGGQPPSPQQLGQGLQQQAMMQRQMPMSNQRQPQAAGRMPPQLPMRGRR